MNGENVQDLIERALESAIEGLDIIATDPTLDRHLRETQALCNQALMELRGYGHEAEKEEWQKENGEN